MYRCTSACEIHTVYVVYVCTGGTLWGGLFIRVQYANPSIAVSLHKPLPARYVIHTQCVSHRAGHVCISQGRPCEGENVCGWYDGIQSGCGGSGITRRGWAPYRSQMYSITIQTQYMYCTFGVTARGWAPYHEWLGDLHLPQPSL
jgi:hypothetical protein